MIEYYDRTFTCQEALLNHYVTDHEQSAHTMNDSDCLIGSLASGCMQRDATSGSGT
jgi:hypothetical protein